MRKLVIIIAALAILLGCSDNPPPAGRLAGIGKGTGAYYIQSGEVAAKALAGGALYRIAPGGAPGAVSFLDESGAPLSVDVLHAITLSDGRLVLGVSYQGQESGIIADPATGEVLDLVPEPEGWDYAREAGGKLYYIAGSSLWRADLSTGIGERMSAEGEALSAEAWLKVTSSGGVVYVDTSESYVTDQGVNTGAGQRYFAPEGGLGVRTNLQLPVPGGAGFALEAPGGVVYSVQISGSDVILYPYTEGAAPGDYVGGAADLLVTLPWDASSPPYTRLNSARQTGEVVIGTEGGIVRISAGQGGLSYSVTARPDAWVNVAYIGAPGSYSAADGVTIYHAYHDFGVDADVTRYHLWGVETSTLVARGLAPAALEILTDYRISDLTAVGGRLFYVRDLGSGPQTMIVEGGQPVLYSDGALNIQAVQ